MMLSLSFCNLIVYRQFLINFDFGLSKLYAIDFSLLKIYSLKSNKNYKHKKSINFIYILMSLSKLIEMYSTLH